MDDTLSSSSTSENMLNSTVVMTNSTSSSELFISNDDNDEINSTNLTSTSGVVWNETVKINETETTTTPKTTVTAPKWMIEFVEFRKRLFLQTVEPIIVQILGPGEEPYDVNDHFLIRHQHPNYFLSSSSSSSMLRHHQHDYDDKTIEFNMTGTAATSSTGSSNLSSVIHYYDENQTVTRTRTLHRQQHHHRQLGFLPDYVENASSFRETSMTFATLITLFVTMASVLLIFLSCFYHNQK
jgi:hypothetical protein